MGSEIARVKLADVSDMWSGGTPSKDRAEYWDGDLPWVSAKDMKERRLRDAEDHITQSGLARASRVAPVNATLVLVRGMTLLNDVPICSLAREMAFNQDVKAIVPTKEIEPDYLTYALLAAKPELLSMVELAGHGTGRLPTDRLKALQIPLPSKREQRSVADILRALDEKVELNRRMNETLEAIARSIFKSWFVDFDPVRAKTEDHQPYGTKSDVAALFPNKFQDSPVGRIPYGWRLGSLGEVSENRRDTVNEDEIINGTPYIALEHMPKRCIALAEWTSADGVESGKFRFNAGDFLFGKLRPYFHKVGVAPIDGVCSTDILVIEPKSAEWSGFVLGHVSSVELVAYSTARSDGTKMPRTNWNDLAAYPVVLPNSQVAAAFGQIVTPMLAKIRANIMESRSLAAIRDALLPKLVSGEIQLTNRGRRAEVA